MNKRSIGDGSPWTYGITTEKGEKMKTLFDLRENTDDGLYEDVKNLFDEPLKIIKFGDKSINSCIGCWNCWLKTPGRCVMRDEMTDSYPDYINSDTVILLMDTAQGFINHKAKAFIDRSIPHYNPYIEILDGECHHVARYDKYPDLLFYFDKAGLENQEEQVIEDYLYRVAYQFKSNGYRLDDSMQMIQLKSRNAKRAETGIVSIGPVDKLVIYNGSPRKSGSNSAIILNKVSEMLKCHVEIRDLKEKDKWEIWADGFKSEKHVMFFLPLYVHAMPSHVMKFIEKLEPSNGSISFFIQSGFPESSQSHYLEAYFEQLALRLKRTHIGTAIKGGVEGLQMRPVAAQEKMIEPIAKAVVNLVNDGAFNELDIQQLAMPIRFGKGTIILFNILCKFGLTNFFWDRKLKENNAYEKRFDRPYLEQKAE